MTQLLVLNKFANFKFSKDIYTAADHVERKYQTARASNVEKEQQRQKCKFYIEHS